MRRQARENLISAKEKSKIYYDKKINPLEVKIGDNVFSWKGGKIKKLDSHYTGPYEICKRIDDLIEIVPCFIDMVGLWPYLIQTGIFNKNDCNIPTWSRNLKNPDRIKDIFHELKQEDWTHTKI